MLGIELNLAECPRIFPEGEGAASMDDFNGASAAAHSNANAVVNTRIAQFMRGDENILEGQEKAAEAGFTNFVQTSASYAAARNGRVKADTRGYLGKFQCIEKGNEIPDAQEFESDVDEDIYDADELTRWELKVMGRFWKYFASVPVSNPGDDEDGYKATLQPGITSVAAQKYLLHDLRTIRMRCMLRGVSEDTTKNITSAYNFAQQYFGEA